MSTGDRFQCVDTGLIIEQHPAATVDLQVDKARHQYAVEFLGSRFLTADAQYSSVGNRDADAILKLAPIENGGGKKMFNAHRGITHYRVAVTFFKPVGASGLKPRATATAATSR